MGRRYGLRTLIYFNPGLKVCWTSLKNYCEMFVLYETVTSSVEPVDLIRYFCSPIVMNYISWFCYRYVIIKGLLSIFLWFVSYFDVQGLLIEAFVLWFYFFFLKHNYWKSFLSFLAIDVNGFCRCVCAWKYAWMEMYVIRLWQFVIILIVVFIVLSRYFHPVASL